MEKDISTEEKIKEAARKVFQEKGYGQARTRDIADAAGINLALLNYYFRSKEKLFDIIMEESLSDMFSVITGVVNNQDTSLSEKIDIIVSRYTDELLSNPNLPLFVLSEIQANPQRLLKRVGVPPNMMTDSCFYKQIEQQVKKEGITVSPFHFFINLVSMSIFPVVGKPLLMSLHTSMTTESYLEFIEERRQLIPQWIKMMLKLDK